MSLIIGKQQLECQSFRVKAAYGETIARLNSLPLGLEMVAPKAVEITLKGDDYEPSKSIEKVYWNRKLIGWFVVSSSNQEWDGDRYKLRIELKECTGPDIPLMAIPLYKWRHDLLALSMGRSETEGAKIVAGRVVDPIAPSWKRNSL